MSGVCNLVECLLREEFICCPGVYYFNFPSAGLTLVHGVVGHHLLQHLLPIKIELSVDPQYLWQYLSRLIPLLMLIHSKTFEVTFYVLLIEILNSRFHLLNLEVLINQTSAQAE